MAAFEPEEGFLDGRTFLSLIDSVYDEIFIYDGNYRMVYINRESKRYQDVPDSLDRSTLYGSATVDPLDISILHHVYETKQPFATRQRVSSGIETATIAVPIFGEESHIEYVVMCLRRQLNDLLEPPTADAEITEPLAPETPFLFESPEMEQVIGLIDRLARTDASCVLTGESGTGKTLLAKYMHRCSTRAHGPFVSVNCASLPQSLIESELFGYAQGAFTGAKREGQKGLFQAANGGTLLLDEISELPHAAQAKLLHVLQEKSFLPVGATQPIQVDVRVVAATNQNLRQLAQTGGFRADLYYRLNVFEIEVPPLRRREKDIALLANHYLQMFSKKYQMAHLFSEDALRCLEHYTWPGNVRELSHVVERLTVLVDEHIIEPRHLPQELLSDAPPAPPPSLPDSVPFDAALMELERQLVCSAYEKHPTTRQVAERLGISQTRASKLLRKYLPKQTPDAP